MSAGVRLTAARRAWSARTEAATLALDATANKKAQRAFDALNVAEQAQLAFEAAHTRRRELCMAYRNVVAVTSGRKQRQNPRTGLPRLTGQPCVIFIVRRKWAGKKPPRGTDPRQALPRFLLAFRDDGDQRAICAIPTDVVVEQQFSRARAQATAGVLVSDTTNHIEGNGNIACAVRATQENGTQKDYMLSCLHVFTPAPDVNIGGREGAWIIPLQGGPELGKSIRQGGALYWNNNSPKVSHSFDAQLASITNPSGLKTALSGLVLSSQQPTVTFTEFRDLAYGRHSGKPATFIIMAPSGGQNIKAQFSHNHLPETPLSYLISHGGLRIRAWIHLEWAIALKFSGTHTQNGDSGSAVIYPRDDGSCTFIGMHAGLTGDGYSVVIPAWQLFDGERYTPRLTSIRPVNPR